MSKLTAAILTAVMFLGIVSIARASDQVKVNLSGVIPLRTVALKEIAPDRVMTLDRAVTLESIIPLLGQLNRMALSPKLPAYLIIDSPGGEMFSGLNFVRNIKGAKAVTGLKLTCIIRGEAASMAAIIAINCDRTFIDPSGALMFHQPSFGMQGNANIMKSRVEHTLKWIHKVESDVATQLGLTYEVYKDLTKDELWLTSEEAASMGFVDGIAESYYVPTPPPAEQNLFQKFFTKLKEGIYAKAK